MQHLIAYCNDEEGVTAIEYSLIDLLFILASVGAIASAGEPLASIWLNITSQMSVTSG